MILISLNEPSVTLQVYALEQDGSDKLDVSSGTVRVYYVAAGSEVELLVSTPLVQVGATNVWRYEWSPVSFPTGEYIAEFSLVDVYGSSTTIGEDVVVRDLGEAVYVVVGAGGSGDCKAGRGRPLEDREQPDDVLRR